MAKKVSKKFVKSSSRTSKGSKPARAAAKPAKKKLVKTAAKKTASKKSAPAATVKKKLNKPAPRGGKVTTKPSKKSAKLAPSKKIKRPQVQTPASFADAEIAPQSGVTLSQAKLVPPEKSLAFAMEVARLLRDDKCEDVVCLDVRGRSPVTDYIVIGSGTSDRQMRSVLQNVEDYGAKTGNQCVRRSIDERATWILADFVDVVVHLFEPNTRAHYDLEMLWGDSKRVAWERPDQISRDYAGLNS